MKIENSLIEILNSLESSFEDDELAYLGFTGKIENHVRDRIAYKLQKILHNSGYMVGREWDTRLQDKSRKRVDLAVFHPCEPSQKLIPACLVELKAGYAFDFVEGHTHWGEYVNKDLQALERISEQYPSVSIARYAIMLATNVDKIIDDHLFPIFRHSYSETVNKFYSGKSKTKRAISSNDLEGILVRNMPDIGNEARCGVWNGGQSFGQNVRVFWWLLKLGEINVKT